MFLHPETAKQDARNKKETVARRRKLSPYFLLQVRIRLEVDTVLPPWLINLLMLEIRRLTEPRSLQLSYAS